MLNPLNEIRDDRIGVDEASEEGIGDRSIPRANAKDQIRELRVGLRVKAREAEPSVLDELCKPRILET